MSYSHQSTRFSRIALAVSGVVAVAAIIVGCLLWGHCSALEHRIDNLEARINSGSTYVAGEDSVSQRIIAKEGNLLPVEIADFFIGDKGFDSVQEYYGSLGIVIGEQVEDLPGWHDCQLPNGWFLQYNASGNSRDESVSFHAADGTEMFTLIVYKDPSLLTAHLCPN